MDNKNEYFNNLKGQTRDKAVIEYRKILIQNELGSSIDCRPVNEKIIERWSMSGLEYIKKNAWRKKHKEYWRNDRTYVVAKNTKFEYDVFYISMRDFWMTGLVGFAEHSEALEHCANMIKHNNTKQLAS